MKTLKKYQKWFSFIFMCATLGCTASKPGNGPFKYALPWDADGQGVQMKIIEIDDLSSPYELSGGSAVVRVDPEISLQGFLGPVAQPNLLKDGDVYIPTDTKSFAAVTAYAHFNRLKKFDERLGLDSGLAWPRRVGVELEIKMGAYFVHNNAFYLPKLDVIGVLPYEGGGLPLSINSGVLAHEHFHAHFQHHVDYFGHYLKAALNYEKEERLPEQLQANLVVFQAWDEALADFYAYVYNKKASAVMDSFNMENRKLNRKFSKKPRFYSSSIIRKKIECMNKKYESCEGHRGGFFDKKEDDFVDIADIYRPMSEELAVFMYKLAGDREEEVLKATFKVFAQIKDKISSIQLDEDVIVPEYLIELLFTELKLHGNDKACALATELLSEEDGSGKTYKVQLKKLCQTVESV